MRKRKKKIKKIILVVFLIIAFFFIYSYLKEQEERRQILLSLEQETVKVKYCYVYGTHFNIEGTITGIPISNIKDVKIVLISKLSNEKEFSTDYKIKDNKIEVKLSKLINEGIYLDSIDTGRYYCALKVIYLNNNVKYYSIENKTNDSDIEYYAITNKNKNKRIKISFQQNKASEIPYTSLKVERIKLPSNVYDISIDPGHGGSDPGAVNGRYKEADIVIKYGKALKEELEKIGLKVLLTRDGTEDTSEESRFNVYSVYDTDGRVNIVGRSKVKYNFSIHVNSFDTNIISGVEIYAPPNASLTFAQDLADNIVESANTTYSTRDLDKASKGVYVRTFTEEEIQKSKEDAQNNGYLPYNITKDTPYLYMIREPGGNITGAYVDGRNKDYGKNEYVDSNIGVESYLIELGYIINENDLNNMLNHQELYIKAITQAIQKNIYK